MNVWTGTLLRLQVSHLRKRVPICPSLRPPPRCLVGQRPIHQLPLPPRYLFHELWDHADVGTWGFWRSHFCSLLTDGASCNFSATKCGVVGWRAKLNGLLREKSDGMIECLVNYGQHKIHFNKIFDCDSICRDSGAKCLPIIIIARR